MRTLADAVRRSIVAETFPALLERLYREQFDGTLILHFGAGVPREAEVPATPQRIRLDKPSDASAQLTRSLDSRGSRRGSADNIVA